jgi:hypothetical protein
MKRFIDLRGQGTLHRFAWWCTVRDCFDEYASDEAWDTWDEFAQAVEDEHMSHLLDRYRPLVPAWAFEPSPDDDYDEDTVTSE